VDEHLESGPIVAVGAVSARLALASTTEAISAYMHRLTSEDEQVGQRLGPLPAR
jgi:hypothetical protein